MKAEVIAIGDELTTGQRLDTNSQWISRELAALGVVTAFHTTVTDALDDGVAAFRIAVGRADLVVVTGGLGPTADDLTRDVLAIVAATRAAPELELGASPRGALALFRAAQARATLLGRDYATPDDVLPPRRVGGDGSTGFTAPVSAERWREEVERAAGRLDELAASTVGQW
jgi:molybdenum cofactor synthesis domain-containing protein